MARSDRNRSGSRPPAAATGQPLDIEDGYREIVERHFRPGEVIYRQGTAGDFAYILRRGRVALTHIATNGTETVETVAPGDVFGEMSIVLNRRRRYTATAVDDVLVDMIRRVDFLRMIGPNGEELRPLVQRLLRRIHRPEIDYSPPPPPPAPGLPRIELMPASEETAALLETERIVIDRLPFSVGRRSCEGEAPGGERNDLALWDERPYNLSRRHFVLGTSEEGVIIRDSSRLGTYINGIHIWGWSSRRWAPLEPGENEIVAGSDTSPFRFIVTLDPA